MRGGDPHHRCAAILGSSSVVSERNPVAFVFHGPHHVIASGLVRIERHSRGSRCQVHLRRLDPGHLEQRPFHSGAAVIAAHPLDAQHEYVFVIGSGYGWIHAEVPRRLPLATSGASGPPATSSDRGNRSSFLKKVCRPAANRLFDLDSFHRARLRGFRATCKRVTLFRMRGVGLPVISHLEHLGADLRAQSAPDAEALVNYHFRHGLRAAPRLFGIGQAGCPLPSSRCSSLTLVIAGRRCAHLMMYVPTGDTGLYMSRAAHERLGCAFAAQSCVHPAPFDARALGAEPVETPF